MERQNNSRFHIDFHIDNLEIMAFMNGLVFFAPVALLVRTKAGLSLEQFFLLQAILSAVIFVLEIPTGMFTDRIGYRNSLILSEVTLLLARIMILAAFLSGDFRVFLAEALVEGVSVCFSSGTMSAYLYQQYDDREYVVKNARIGNFGTAGFIVSTITYAVIYRMSGLKGLLIATVLSGAAGAVSSLGIEEERHLKKKDTEKKDTEKKDTEKKEAGGRIGKIGINLQNVMIVVILACVSISFILINFFYVDKLQVLGIGEEWMTVIILGYSAIELLSEKLLARIDERNHLLTFMLGFLLVGVMMVLFGTVNEILIVIPIMLLLPLAVIVPGYIFDKIENKVIDANGQQNCRAEVLSIYNMGVNLVEILFLFTSAYVSKAGISLSFVLTGVIMGIMGVTGYVVFGKKEDI